MTHNDDPCCRSPAPRRIWMPSSTDSEEPSRLNAVRPKGRAVPENGLYVVSALTTWQRVLLVALLSTAAIVYALPVGRRPIGVADEARQALLAEDTLRHGLRLPARVRDEPDLQKPPLFFWSVASAAVPAGHVSDRNASIPSVVAALATLLGVFFLGRQLSGAHTGFLALAVLATSPGFFLRSHEVRPDMMLTAWLTWALGFFLLGLRSLPPQLGHLAGFYLCVAGALWTKGLPCLMVIPAGVAAVAASVGVRKLPLFRPLTGLALVALTALPWVVPYSRAPGSEGSEIVSVSHALTQYLNHFRHHPSVPFVDGLVEFLPWTLWLIPAVVWWRLTPDRQAYRPVLAWMAAFLLLLGLSVYQRSHALLASRLSAVRPLRGRVGDHGGLARPIPALDPRHNSRRRDRHGAGRGRMASAYPANLD